MLVCDRCGETAARYYNLGEAPAIDLCPPCKAEFDKMFAMWRRGATLVVTVGEIPKWVFK